MNSHRSKQSLAVLIVLLLTACATVPRTAVAPTTIPTPFPFPTRSALAFSYGTELGLGYEFQKIWRGYDLTARFPAALVYAAGIKEFRDSTYPDALIPWFRFPAKNNFAFGTSDNTQFVEGSSVLLKDAESQETFDDLFIAQLLPLEQKSVSEWTSDVAPIQDVAVGDKSSGIVAQPTVDGFAWRLEAVSFRLGDIGAFVFTLYPAAATAPADVVKLAQVYADSLKQ